MIYDQAVAGVDASREPLQERVSQKETSEPNELGSRGMVPVPPSLPTCAEMVAFIADFEILKAILCGSQGLGGQNATAMSKVTSLQCLTLRMHVDTSRI